MNKLAEIARSRLIELEEEYQKISEERTKNDVEESTKQARLEFVVETINRQRNILGLKPILTKSNAPFIDPNED